MRAKYTAKSPTTCGSGGSGACASITDMFLGANPYELALSENVLPTACGSGVKTMMRMTSFRCRPQMSSNLYRQRPGCTHFRHVSEKEESTPVDTPSYSSAAIHANLPPLFVSKHNVYKPCRRYRLCRPDHRAFLWSAGWQRLNWNATTITALVPKVAVGFNIALLAFRTFLSTVVCPFSSILVSG